MLNTVVLLGTITSQLVKKETEKGAPYVRFEVETINEYNQKTNYIPVVAWNNTAKEVLNCGSVGKQVLVRGMLVQHQSYNSSRFDVSADSVVFVDAKDTRYEDYQDLQEAMERKREEENARRTKAWIEAEKERLESE